MLKSIQSIAVTQEVFALNFAFASDDDEVSLDIIHSRHCFAASTIVAHNKQTRVSCGN